MAETSSQAPTPVVMSAKDSAFTDPSPRSLEVIYREAKQLEDKILLRFDTIQTKFHGYDEAVRLLQEFANRQPTTEAVNGDVKALKELVQTQLRGVGAEVAGLKELINAIFEGNKAALNAALTTQKESSDKIERGFTDQFKNMAQNLAVLTKTFDDKINDIKDRYNTSEGKGVGKSATWGAVAAIITAVAAAAAIIAVIINNMN